MFHTTLDIENLEQISFERSKFWANLINKFEEKDDNEDDDCMIEIGFNENDGNEDDDASINSSNEAEEVDIFEDEDIINGAFTAGSNELPTVLLHVENTADIQTLLNCEEGSVANAELQDLLNETVPLLKEHKRKWEEAGINRILNTFDRRKIEEKVGGWLRRNQSGGSALSISPIAGRNSERRFCNPKIALSADRHVVETDTDTSLHSMDTARYIRSSRQQRHGNRLGSSSSTATMTIKTFRLVQKKREALRKKYACLDSDDDDDVVHCRSTHNPPCHRYNEQQQRQQSNQVVNTNNNVAVRESVAVALEERRCNHRSQHKVRRKHLRRYRHASTSSSDSYSSLSCSSMENAVKYNKADLKKGLRLYRKIKHRRRRVSKKRMCCRTVCCGRAYRYSFSSSSSHSYVCNGSNRKLKGVPRAITNMESDLLPLKRESDCRCCSDIKLCRETRHLADTSTEDWMVENCDSPRKKFNLASPSCHREQLDVGPSVSGLVKYYEQNKQNAHKHILAFPTKDTKIGTHLKDAEKNVEKKENVQKLTKKNSNSLQKCVENKEREKSLQNKPKNRRKRKAEKEDQEETFLKELEKAIEISKKTYEKEKEERQNQNVSTNLNGRNNRKRSEESIAASLEISPAKVTKTFVANDMPSISSDSETIETPFKKIIVKPQPRSVKLRKLLEMSEKKSQKFTADDTFFQFAKNIYNSTALANDTAMPREVFSGPMLTKSSPTISTAKKRANATAISSTVKSNTSTSPRISIRSSCSPMTENNDNDCIIVSSTTGVDPQQQPPSHDPQDILLYKPTAKSLASAHKLDNGFINITQKDLSAVIGEKHAQKFLKYYIGRLRFSSNSTIYYRPPAQPTAMPLNADDSTDSDEDTLECVFKYGDLHESINMGYGMQ